MARIPAAWSVLLLCLAATMAAAQETRQIAVLQIHIVEGEGAVHGIGSRTSRALTVQISDETGRPVEGAAVNFRLPDEEPSGTFASGLRTDVQVTGPDGKVSLPLVQWGFTPGPLRVRVTAAKDHARAGTLVSNYLTELAAGPAAEGSTRRGDDEGGGGTRIGRGKLFTAALLAAGAVAGGLVLTRGSAAGSSAPGLIGGSTQQPTQVGPPLIRITRP